MAWTKSGVEDGTDTSVGINDLPVLGCSNFGGVGIPTAMKGPAFHAAEGAGVPTEMGPGVEEC